ncbi:hypothetical protein A0H81_05066 [Grifola frondosa]|uniref:F-box domain-containing protein n=1 Tax=Grifola frondosa TaxID=5627 RepID=A0A1C7MDT0_GRIFR|nr:hypothetical protein A0H81_05066 [Grifola frondosa]
MGTKTLPRRDSSRYCHQKFHNKHGLGFNSMLQESLEAFLEAVSTISPNAVWTLSTASPSFFYQVELARFSALRKVELAFSSYTSDLFEKLSRLDYLNDLLVNSLDGTTPQIGRGRFAALQNIEFCVRGEHNLPELLTNFSFPRLQSAHIIIRGRSDIATKRRILDALCSGSPLLCTLMLNFHSRGHAKHPSMKLLEPLLALSRMKELQIMTTARLSVSEDDIRMMAQSWPELESLDMNYTCVGPAPPIQSIVEFAQHCPRLRRLHFPRFSCVSHTFPPTSVPSPHCERRLELRGLDIDVDDVELCWRAAEFIEGMFPGEEDLEDGKVYDAGSLMVRSMMIRCRDAS